MLFEKVNLQYHRRLNKRIFDSDDIMKDDVRKQLLKFAEFFRSFAKIPQFIVTDILMTGGNANYNYTVLSDIDVHLLIDRTKMGSDAELVDDYLQDKKTLFTLTNHIKVAGYNVEPYAQDITESIPKNQGCYSILNNIWVQHPENLKLKFSKDEILEKGVEYYSGLINHIIDAKLDLDNIKVLKDKMRSKRNTSIAKDGEFGRFNLIFKSLRNDGLLDRLNAYEKTLQLKKYMEQ